MCCTAMPSRLSRTILLNAIVNHPKLAAVRVLGYEAIYDNRIDGSNMLVWPLGLKEGLTRENFIETKGGGADVLQTMARALAPTVKGVTLGTSRGASKLAEVFDYNDSATVVLSPSVEKIMDALEQLDGQRKPNYTPARLISWMGKAYPDEMIAVVVFWNNTVKRFPVMLWEPVSDAYKFRFYTTDFHGDGRHDAPNLNERVDVDHTLIVAHPNMTSGVRPRYSVDVPQGIMDFIPPKIAGKLIQGAMKNGDFEINVANLAGGDVYFRRVAPPGVLA